jgi:hypothetical protein
MVVIFKQRSELIKTNTTTLVVIVLLKFLLSDFRFVAFLNKVHELQVTENSIEKVFDR